MCSRERERESSREREREFKRERSRERGRERESSREREFKRERERVQKREANLDVDLVFEVVGEGRADVESPNTSGGGISKIKLSPVVLRGGGRDLEAVGVGESDGLKVVRKDDDSIVCSGVFDGEGALFALGVDVNVSEELRADHRFGRFVVFFASEEERAHLVSVGGEIVDGVEDELNEIGRAHV